MALNPGAKFGPYTVLGPLGRGGMASVYKCHEPALDRHIALKVLPREFLHDESFAERFRREAKVIARLEHPNIVPIHAYGIEDGIPWMAMRCISGGSLSGVLKNRRLDERRVLSVLRGVAEALDHAHSQGVVHRDVKPQNILLDEAGRVYLADFGIAKMAEASGGLTATGMITGTPQYMAPEQAKGVGIDHRADIYALGVVAYELLTGQTPFAADTPIAVLMKHLSEPVPRPSALDLPEAASDALLKCLAKDPAERWPTAVAFVDALERGMTHGVPTLVPLDETQSQPAPVTTRRASPAVALAPAATPLRTASPPVPTGAPSIRGWLVGIGGGVVVLLLGGVWLLYEARRVVTPQSPAAEATPAVVSPSPTPSVSGTLRSPSAPSPEPVPSEPSRPIGTRTSPVPPPVHSAPALPPPVQDQKAAPSSEVAPAPAGSALSGAPGAPAAEGRLDGTVAFTPNLSAPLSLASGAVTATSVRFQARDGKSGRFKRMVSRGGGVATVQAAVELVRKPKAGDWNVVIGVELLDEAAHVVATFEEKFGVEDDRSTVNLVQELGKDDLARVTRARIHVQATKD
jgi:serine/threonine protein kinase